MQVLENGNIIEALPYCIDMCKQKSCQKFYSSIMNANEGFYTCPKGLTAYVSRANTPPLVYTSMRVKGFYNKGSDDKLKRSTAAADSFSPVMSRELFMRLMETDMLVCEQSSAVKIEQNVNNELLHDIRKICAHIKNKSEDIIGLDDDIQAAEDNCDAFDTLQKIKNIEAMAGIAVSRFEEYDISMNPESMCFGHKRPRVIYQKFHKAKYMLTNYMEKMLLLVCRAIVLLNILYTRLSILYRLSFLKMQLNTHR